MGFEGPSTQPFCSSTIVHHPERVHKPEGDLSLSCVSCRLCTSCTARQRPTDICTTTPSPHRKRSLPRARTGRRCDTAVSHGAASSVHERDAAAIGSALHCSPITSCRAGPNTGLSAQPGSVHAAVAGKAGARLVFCSVYIAVLLPTQSAFDLQYTAYFPARLQSLISPFLINH